MDVQIRSLWTDDPKPCWVGAVVYEFDSVGCVGLCGQNGSCEEDLAKDGVEHDEEASISERCIENCGLKLLCVVLEDVCT